jgi:hypothetical protein
MALLLTPLLLSTRVRTTLNGTPPTTFSPRTLCLTALCRPTLAGATLGRTTLSRTTQCVRSPPARLRPTWAGTRARVTTLRRSRSGASGHSPKQLARPLPDPSTHATSDTAAVAREAALGSHLVRRRADGSLLRAAICLRPRASEIRQCCHARNELTNRTRRRTPLRLTPLGLAQLQRARLPTALEMRMKTQRESVDRTKRRRDARYLQVRLSSRHPDLISREPIIHPSLARDGRVILNFSSTQARAETASRGGGRGADRWTATY